MTVEKWNSGYRGGLEKLKFGGWGGGKKLKFRVPGGSKFYQCLPPCTFSNGIALTHNVLRIVKETFPCYFQLITENSNTRVKKLLTLFYRDSNCSYKTLRYESWEEECDVMISSVTKSSFSLTIQVHNPTHTIPQRLLRIITSVIRRWGRICN